MDLHPPFQFKLNYRLDKRGPANQFWLIASLRCGRHYAVEGYSGAVDFHALLRWLRRLITQRLPADFYWMGPEAGGAHFAARQLAKDSPNIQLEITPRSANRNAPPVIQATVPRLEVVGVMLRALYAYAHSLEAAGVEEPSGLTSADILAFEPLIKNPPAPGDAAPSDPLPFSILEGALWWHLEGPGGYWTIDDPDSFWPRWFDFLLKVAGQPGYGTLKFEHPDKEYIDRTNEWVKTGAIPPVHSIWSLGDRLEVSPASQPGCVRLELWYRSRDDEKKRLDQVFEKRALLAAFCDAYEDFFAEWAYSRFSVSHDSFDFRTLKPQLSELRKAIA